MGSYNDAVHGKQVVLSDVGEALFQHPALLQLRGKKQLAMKDRLFTNATHTRYLHSVGAMIAAGRLARSLDLTDADRKLLECAAALHDIGHYPFSHATERVRGLHHEDVPQLVLAGEDFGALEARPLIGTLTSLGVSASDVASVLAGTHALSPLISNDVVDADRLDYLARDFLACGVTFGADVDRVIQELTFIDGTVGVTRSGVVSLTSFLVARSLAYDQIYQHRRVEVAETMLMWAVAADPDLSERSRENDERVHRMSDAELLLHLERSEDALARGLAVRLRGSVGDWYQPVWEIGGEEGLSEAVALWKRRHEVEEALRAHGLLWSWNSTKRFASDKPAPRFPVSDGTDLFDRRLARAAWGYVPERLLSVYAPVGGAEGEELAARALQPVISGK